MINYNYAIKYKCINCENEYPIKQEISICPSCFGNLDIVYNYKAIKKRISRKILTQRVDCSIFRYHEFLPLVFNINKYSKHPILQTSLLQSERLGIELGYNSFYIKDETRHPSCSFKDRASIMALIHAVESGHRTIITASTGNAASSLACLSSAFGIQSIIIIPKTAPVPKVAQLMMYGASVIMIDGTYDDAYDLSLAVSKKYSIYNRNTGYNPFTREGKKTVSFEIAQQMKWNIPDYLFVPMGDGNILSGTWKGFKDLFTTGLINKLPQLIGVQSNKSPAIVRAFNEKQDIKKTKSTTIADSISVDYPRDGKAALKALQESNGQGILVSDKEILQAQKLLAEMRGIFAEPAGSAAMAGLIRCLKDRKISTKKTACVLVTGNGLKDINTVIKNVKLPVKLKPQESVVFKEIEKIIQGR